LHTQSQNVPGLYSVLVRRAFRSVRAQFCIMASHRRPCVSKAYSTGGVPKDSHNVDFCAPPQRHQFDYRGLQRDFPGTCKKNNSALSSSTAVLPKIPHSNSCKRVPNRPLRPRRGRFGTILQQLECGVFGRTAVYCLKHNDRGARARKRRHHYEAHELAVLIMCFL